MRISGGEILSRDAGSDLLRCFRKAEGVGDARKFFLVSDGIRAGGVQVDGSIG